jgi:two-component system, OmpR family, sensor histidine kinase SenX3
MLAAVVLLLLALATVVAVVGWWTWRGLRRDLQSVATRLGDQDTDEERQRGIESVFAYLEQAAEEAHATASQAEGDRDRFYEVLRASADGVVVVDAEGATALRNEAAERYRAARHSDALVEEAVGELLDGARRGQGGERELQLFGPPREVLEVRAIPLRDGARIVGAAAFIRDISESRRTDSVRRDFVANVSHELKTPIGALALLAETMAAGGDPSVMQQLAERMLREADRLGRIVDDLLDLSLIEAQEAPIREPVPAPVLIGEAVERVRAAADAGSIPLRVVEAPSELVVTCDRRQVVSAITNLLDNAVKYSEPGAPVELVAAVEGEKLAITVRDQGVGIPSRDLERIFERFYRVDRARSRATGGTGLGLSIVRHVAHAHGGDVTVESCEGEGSTFRFSVPLAAGQGRGLAVAPDVREAS